MSKVEQIPLFIYFGNTSSTFHIQPGIARMPWTHNVRKESYFEVKLVHHPK